MRTLEILAVAALLVATASTPAAAADTPDTLRSDLVGSARMYYPVPEDNVRVTVDAHAKFSTDGGSFPDRSWGTFRIYHRVAEPAPGQPPLVNWGDFEVDCLTTGGPTATVTGTLVRVAPDSPWQLGDRTGVSFYVPEQGQSRIGLAGLPETPLPPCMAPAADSPIVNGGYELTDRSPQ